jgi:sugar lactone lactonase YvrE
MTAGTTPASVLLDGLAYAESPRWHRDRLWFCHWGTGEIVAVDMAGNSDVVGHGPAGLGWGIDWLPDGRLLVTGEELLRCERDGSMVRHSDLRAVSLSRWSEIVVDGRANIYVNSIGFDFVAGEPPGPGLIALVTPDGCARAVAGDLAFPNGMVVTPDNSTLIVSESMAGQLTAFDVGSDGTLSNRRMWASGVAPDGICLDTDGAVWTHDAQAHECVRVAQAGEVLDRVQLDRACFACMLGGPERRTLFILVADWEGTEGIDAALARRTGQILVADAPAPGAGWP